MKKLVNRFNHLFHAPTLITFLVVGFVIAAIVQAAAPPVQPSGEIIIPTNQSTNLNCNYIRVTGGRIALDQSITNWSVEFRWEAWRTNNTPRIIDRGSLQLSADNLKSLLNAANPKNALKNQILQDAALTEKN